MDNVWRLSTELLKMEISLAIGAGASDLSHVSNVDLEHDVLRMAIISHLGHQRHLDKSRKKTYRNTFLQWLGLRAA